MGRLGGIFVFGVFIVGVFIFLHYFFQSDKGKDNPVQKLSDTVKNIENSVPFRAKHKPATEVTGSIFVPYWRVGSLKTATDVTLPETIQHKSIDYVIYFGVGADKDGIIETDPGYRGLSSFTQVFDEDNIKTLLTVRMLDEEVNDVVLESQVAQNNIAREAVKMAQDNGFSGIVLDFEHSVLPTKKTTEEITGFFAEMSESAHESGLSFAVTVYGDTFYRARPYDIEHIEPYVDLFYVMTYDFHKSYGTPGPNFPLHATDFKNDLVGAQKGVKQYGYSIEHMIADIMLAGVKPDKVVPIFGMYGYDWMVDDENRPLKPAEAVTLNQARSRYSADQVVVDPVSAENSVTFTDDSGQKHVIWFENERSAQQKIKYVMTEGISKVGYWAWGYY